MIADAPICFSLSINHARADSEQTEVYRTTASWQSAMCWLALLPHIE